MVLKVLLVVTAVAGIVGLLTWRIVSLRQRRRTRSTRSDGTSRPYRIPELSPDEVARGFTIYVPIAHVGDATRLADADEAQRVPTACGVPIGM